MFRFAFVFFVLFILVFPNVGAPGFNALYDFYIMPLDSLVTWLAAHVLHLTKPVTNLLPTGSGDTTYDWILLSLVAVLSVVGTAIWSVLSRKPVSYDRLYYWLIVILRFYVGITMVAYGSFKVIKLQFPSPSPFRLSEAYGDSSPMALAWTFMGFSKAYNYFTGIAEVLCGLLLFFRKTTLLGAVIGFTVVANIVAINFCFDVPVKMIASALLLMVIVILLKDLDRMIKFFFLNQAAEAANLTPRRFKKRWKNITLITVKYILIGYTIITNGSLAVQSNNQRGDGVKHPVLYGIFKTQKFVLNKDTLPPLTTDSIRWQRLVISSAGSARVCFMNDSTLNYSYKNDTLAKTITLGSYKDTTCKYIFKYSLSKDSVLQINGDGPHGVISATLKRYDEKNFPLMKRGFHWVNEFPFNR